MDKTTPLSKRVWGAVGEKGRRGRVGWRKVLMPLAVSTPPATRALSQLWAPLGAGGAQWHTWPPVRLQEDVQKWGRVRRQPPNHPTAVVSQGLG